MRQNANLLIPLAAAEIFQVGTKTGMVEGTYQVPEGYYLLQWLDAGQQILITAPCGTVTLTTDVGNLAGGSLALWLEKGTQITVQVPSILVKDPMSTPKLQAARKLEQITGGGIVTPIDHEALPGLIGAPPGGPPRVA